MTSVPPPAPPPLPPSAGVAPAAVEVVPVSPLAPELMARLLAARQVTAVVQALSAPNLVTLRTDLATLTVRLALPVKPGSELTLQLVMPPAGGQPRLVAVGSRSPAPRIQPPSPMPAAPGAAATQASAASGSLVATIVHPEPHGWVLAPQGASFVVRVVGAVAPGAGGAVAPPDIPSRSPVAPVGVAPPLAAEGGAVQAGIGPAPTKQIPSAAPAAPPSPSGGTSAAQPLPPAAPLGGAVPAQFDGIVQSNSHVGQPIVRTPFGLISLEGSIGLPPAGTSVRFEVAGPLMSAPSPASAPVPPPTPWSGLVEAMQCLRRVDPGAAERLAMALPQPGPRLAAGLMIAAAAVQANSMGGLVPEAVVAGLERAGRRDLIKRMAEDVAEAPAPSRGVGGEWRALTLPLLIGVAIEPVRLFMRRPDRADDDEAHDGKAQARDGGRFIVDVRLTRVGRLQLDGLLRRSAKRFEMILRSEQPLPDAARHDIVGIFTTYCDGIGLTGTILFHVGRDFVEPSAGSAPRARAGLVV